MSEIDLEGLEGDGEDVFVPLSEMGGDEPDEPDPSRAALARIYNDLPASITILRHADGAYRNIYLVGPGATSPDFWTTDVLYLAHTASSKALMTFGGGWTYHSMFRRSLPPGTTNYSHVIRSASSATDGNEVEQAGDGALDR
ncbi:hypothetical protein [Nocardia sp. NPDC046763]|uniref:hypothetical protein n=1 Tax=Nocardia sp. NPDC046763 TaxID=3155256 RepID=UPI0034099FE1